MSTFKACFTKRKRQLYFTSVVLLCCMCLLSCSYAWNFTRNIDILVALNPCYTVTKTASPSSRSVPTRKKAQHDVGSLFACLHSYKPILSPSASPLFPEWISFSEFQSILGGILTSTFLLFSNYLLASSAPIISTSTVASLGSSLYVLAIRHAFRTSRHQVPYRHMVLLGSPMIYDVLLRIREPPTCRREWNEWGENRQIIMTLFHTLCSRVIFRNESTFEALCIGIEVTAMKSIVNDN